jgi:hypothetical protein
VRCKQLLHVASPGHDMELKRRSGRYSTQVFAGEVTSATCISRIREYVHHQQWSQEMKSDTELIDAYHIATFDYEAAKAGTGDRLGAFTRLLVAERVLTTRLPGQQLACWSCGRPWICTEMSTTTLTLMLRQCESCANSRGAAGLRNSKPDRKIATMPSR